MKNKFIVLITTGNAKLWIGKCIQSAINQDYPNRDIVVIDDHSTDGTWDIICGYDVIKVRNDKHVGHSLINMIYGIREFSTSKEDIIVSLDGDDWFYDSGVLSYLDKIYTGDIWLTYGQYMPLSGRYKNYCKQISNTRTYRKSDIWVTTHLKTFKKKLWDLIKPEDFLNAQGDYLETGGDRAMMYPMIEMAGLKRIKFIDRILYVYNDLNPMNYMKTDPKLTIDVANYIQRMKPYDEIIGDI